MHNKLTTFVLCALPWLFLVALGAEAQSNEEEREGNRRVIEEIIVSATRRDRSVRDIPISIDAFTGKDLIDRGAVSLEEIVKSSPGVIFTKGSTPDSGNITIRGVSNVGGLFTRTIGRFYDSVSLINPSVAGVQPDLDPFDMANLEILKGPQGTLFGGSALAGAIRYVPNVPDLDEGLAGSISLGLGSVKESGKYNREYTSMLNVPLASSLGFRYAGARREFAGFIDDKFSNEADVNDSAVEQHRLLALWRITDSIDLQFSYLRRDTEFDAQTLIDGDREDIRLERSSRRLPEFGEAQTTIKGAKLSWAVGDILTMIIDSNWLEKSSNTTTDTTPFLGLENSSVRMPTVSDTFVDQPSHELRVVSNNQSGGWWLLRDWDYVFGLFYMKSDQFLSGPLRVQADATGSINQELLDLLDLVELTDPAAGTNTDLTAVATETALYFDLTRHFAPGFELNLGGRYFRQITDGLISAVTVVENPAGEGFLVDIQRDEQIIRRRVRESGFNPKVALTWHVTDDFRLIASVAEGFRFGGVNAINDLTHNISGQPFFFDSDSLVNYEVGFRSTWFDRRLTADFMAFFINWDDMQVQTTFEGTFPAIINIGGSEVIGAELGVQTILPFGFNLGFSASHVDSQTTEFFDSAEGEIHPGTRLPRAPRWTGSAILGYAGQFHNWRVSGTASYSYQGESKNDFNNTLPVPSFDTVGLSLTAENIALRVSPLFRISVTNLQNNRSFLAGVASREGAANDDIMVPVQPRTVTFSFGLSF